MYDTYNVAKAKAEQRKRAADEQRQPIVEVMRRTADAAAALIAEALRAAGYELTRDTFAEERWAPPMADIFADEFHGRYWNRYLIFQAHDAGDDWTFDLTIRPFSRESREQRSEGEAS